VIHLASTDWTTPPPFASALADRLGLDRRLIRAERFDRFAATQRARRPPLVAGYQRVHQTGQPAAAAQRRGGGRRVRRAVTPYGGLTDYMTLTIGTPLPTTRVRLSRSTTRAPTTGSSSTNVDDAGDNRQQPQRGFMDAAAAPRMMSQII
jgi:hypothetical protein